MLPVDKTYHLDRISSKMPKVCIYLVKSASVLVSLEIIFGMDKFGMSESNPATKHFDLILIPRIILLSVQEIPF